MKPYIARLIELAARAKTTEAAKEHLSEAASQVRAALEDAKNGSARDKLDANHDNLALLRIVALLAPTDEKTAWLVAADPHGKALETIFGPPDGDVADDIAEALGLPTKRQLRVAEAEAEEWRSKYLTLADDMRLGKPGELPLREAEADALPKLERAVDAMVARHAEYDKIEAETGIGPGHKPKRGGKKAPAPQPDPEAALAQEREEWLPQPAEA